MLEAARLTAEQNSQILILCYAYYQSIESNIEEY